MTVTTKIDPVSQVYIVLAAMIIIYLAPYGLELFIPLSLLSLSVTLLFVLGKHFPQDPYLDSGEKTNITKHTLVCVIAMVVANLVGINLFPSTITPAGMVFLDVLLLSVLYAISEEFFFRGFVLRFFLWKTKNFFVSIIASGAIFGVYHFKRYGLDQNALFVMFAVGTLLGYVAWKSGRLSPVMNGHIINNVMAVVGRFR